MSRRGKHALIGGFIGAATGLIVCTTISNLVNDPGSKTRCPVFDLDALKCLPQRVDTGWFREWCGQAESHLLGAVERVTATGGFARGGTAATL